MADRKPTVLNPAGYQENLQDADNLIVEAAPTADNHAVNKGYADTEIAEAGKWKVTGEFLEPKDSDLQVKVGSFDYANATTKGTVISNLGGVDIKIATGNTQDALTTWLGNDTKIQLKYDGGAYFDNNVGIGTDSPASLLTLKGGGTSAGDVETNKQIRIKAGDSDAYGGTISWGKKVGDSTYYALAIDAVTNNVASDILLAPSGGNVGIGTDSPGAPLTVKQGTILVTDENSISTGDIGSFGCIWSNAAALASAGYKYEVYTGGNDNRTLSLLVDPNGNVGIGTDSPEKALDVVDEVIVSRTAGAPQNILISAAADNNANVIESNSDAAATKNFYIRNSAAGKHLILQTESTNAVFIQNDGKVGIGTSSPDQKLDVRLGGNTSTPTPTIQWGRTTGAVTGVLGHGLDGVNGIFMDCPTGQSISFQIAGNEKTRITTAGIDVVGRAHINAPSDFWSGGSYYDVGNYGSLCTHGGYALSLVSNGYRGADSKWVSKNVNGFTGAANINIRPEGSITFCTEANKATGDPSGVTVRATVDDSGLDVAGTISADNFDIGGITKDSYLRSDADDSASGTLTFNGRVNIRNHLDLADGNNVDFGSSDDIRMWYQGSDNYLYCDFRTSSGIAFRDSGTNKILLSNGGTFRPATNNTGALGTSSVNWANGYFTNFNVSSVLNVRGNLDLADNNYLIFGTGDDVAMYYNGSHFYTDLKTTGNWYIRDNTTTRYTFGKGGGFVATGSVTSPYIYGTTRVQAGQNGNGAAALTINDGAGNANLTFNHAGNAADQTGNAFRISGNTDTTSAATLTFTVYENIQQGAATGASTGTMHLRPQGLDVTGKVTADQFDLESLPALP